MTEPENPKRKTTILGSLLNSSPPENSALSALKYALGDPEPGSYLASSFLKNHNPTNSLLFMSEFQEKLRKDYEKEADELRGKIDELSASLKDSDSKAKETEEKQAEILGLYNRLLNRDNLRFILDRTSESSHLYISENSDIQQSLSDGSTLTAFIVSIDIRRSTELMLIAKTPKHFAQFITELCSELRAIVFRMGGIFDKFTGDGILAYFPIEFSGLDYGIRAILCAQSCHSAFDRIYLKYHDSFTCVPTDTGLGIGIDHGGVYLTRIGTELTIVGTPVVYACRLNSCGPGNTYLNHPAYQSITTNNAINILVTKKSTNFKNQGDILCYKIDFISEPKSIRPTPWENPLE